ncbi:MAG: MotA/TolQ/ExbB proton channel family protein [Phycisphaeraceae bacterium]
MDIERRLGFPAGPFTQPGPVLPVLAAGALSVAFFLAMPAFADHPVGQSFMQHGWVPYAIVAFSFWALMILLVKISKVRLQRRALAYAVAPSESGFTLTPETAISVLDRLHDIAEEPNDFLLYNRIQFALSNLKNMGRVGDVGEVLRGRSESEDAAVESSYTVVRGLVWGIPVLGFIGTVLGLSQAIGSFGAVLQQSGEMEELRQSLQHVTAGLATAFETTLQALIAALLIQLLMTLVRRNEELMLDSFIDYCDRQVIGHLRLKE